MTIPPPPTPTHRWPKRLLLAVILALLVLPPLQTELHLLEVAPLDGYFDRVPFPKFTWDGLWQSSYQPAMATYAEDRLGFRSWLQRLRNQLAYSVFGQTPVPVVVVGQDDVLFQPVSIEAYLGHDYSGLEMVHRVRRLRVVQDSLRAHGTQLLLVVAPGKARIVPQLLPARYAAQAPQPSNYQAVMLAARKYHLNVLDAAALLQQWQDTTRFPLFPRSGTHWSGYATTLIADTLFRRIEQLTRHDLPDFTSQGYRVATEIDSLRYTDDDLQLILNKIWKIKPYPVAYPHVVFGPETGKRRVNALVIGDSFAQSFYNFYPYYQKLFTPEARYWANYEYVFWPADAPDSHMVRDLNLRQQLTGRDVVLIIATEQNFGQLGFGFIDQAYRLFRPVSVDERVGIEKLYKELQKKATWEEMHNDEQIQQHLHERAESIYDHLHL